MKIDLTVKFLGLDDEPIKDEKGKEMTMYDILRIASVTEVKGDTDGSDAIERRMKNYDIFLNVKNAGPACKEYEISAEEIVHIKARIGQVFSTLICGPAVKILEGKPPYGSVVH